MRAARLAALLALDAGLTVALISPPRGWLVVQLCSWAIAVAVLGRVGPAGALVLGWLAGAAMHLAGFAWLPATVADFFRVSLGVGWIASFAHAAIGGAFVGLFGLGLGRVRRASRSLWPFGIAAWFTACEHIALQPVPFHQGDFWYAHPALFLVTALAGPAGATFLVLAVNGIALEAGEWLAAGRRRAAGLALARNAALALVLLGGAALYSHARLATIARAEASARSIRVAIVQSGLDPAAQSALVRATGDSAIALDLLRRSRETQAAHGPIDAFVWPEGALPDEPLTIANLPVLAFARESGAEIWTGATFAGRDRSGTRRPFNAAFRIDAGGMVDRRYDKRILVPFGERVPFADRFPALSRIPGLGREVPGMESIVYDAAPARFAFLICYEAIFDSPAREAWRNGSDLLVNLTFDGWLGDGAGPYQHLMLAAIHAAQFGIPMLRSAGTGISAVIDARGAITAQSGLHTEGVLVADVEPLRVASPYAALGDWFGWSCVAVSGALGWSGRRHGSPSGPSA